MLWNSKSGDFCEVVTHKILTISITIATEVFVNSFMKCCLLLEEYLSYVNDHTITIVVHLELSKFKSISDYMLIYVRILKLSDHLNILHAGV